MNLSLFLFIVLPDLTVEVRKWSFLILFSIQRVFLRDQSPTTRHSWNHSYFGGNLDKGQPNCIYRSPQVLWFANESNRCEKPSLLTGHSALNSTQTVGSFDLCRSREIAPHLAENSSIGSSSSSHVSTYVMQGTDYSQLLAAQASSSQYQRYHHSIISCSFSSPIPLRFETWRKRFIKLWWRIFYHLICLNMPRLRLVELQFSHETFFPVAR